MDNTQRQNTITWLTQSIQGSYTRLLTAHFPLMLGLRPDDEGSVIMDCLHDMDDEELEELLHLDQAHFEAWLLREIQLFITGCLHDETKEV